MKKMVMVLLAVMLGFIAVFVAIAQAQTEELLIKIMPPVNIVAPPPDLPKELASLSGRWEGTWGATRGPFILICEQITNQEAVMVYVVAPISTHFKSEGGAERYKAKVISGKFPRIEFLSKAGSTFIFILRDKDTLDVVFIGGKGSRLTTTAHRVSN